MPTRSGDDIARKIDAVVERLAGQPADGDAQRSLVELYEQRIALEPDQSLRPALWSELATHCEQVGNYSGAVTALERARAAAPHDVKLAHALATALVKRSEQSDSRTKALDLDRVADLLCDVALALDPVEATQFLLAALSHAPWHARALYELERATPEDQRSSLATHWVAYLAHNPDGDLAQPRRVALARAYLAAGQVEDAVFALEPAAKSGHLEAIALLAKLRPSLPPTAAGEPAQAAHAPERAHSDRPSRPSAPPAAARARGDRPGNPPAPGPWQGDKETPVLAPEPRTARDSQVEERMRDSQVEELPRSARDSQPEQQSRPRTAPAPQDAPSAESALLSAEASDFDDAEALGVQLDPHAIATTPQVEAEIAALGKLLREAQRAGDAARALECAQRILALAPQDAGAFDLADREYRRSRDYRARAQMLLDSAEHEGLPLSTRKLRLRDAAPLFEQKLSDVDGALRCYQALARVDPSSDDALRSMARVLERAQRWDALAECLEQTLDAQHESAQKIALLRRIADVHRRERKDRGAAADALARLIELDPNDRTARTSLADDLTALERWNDLAQLIERRIEEPASKAERVALLRQLANLFEGPLQDAEAAFEAYERILQLAPDDAGALARMEEIDERSGAHERLLTTLQRRIERATHAQAAQLLVRMATIAEADLADRDRAHGFLRKALEYAPQNAQIVSALANLCERAERFEELLALLRERVKSEKQTKPRAELMRRIARLLAKQLNDEAGAAGVYAALNELGDDLEAWTYLEQYARKRSDTSALCQALYKLCQLESEPSVLRARLMERSELLSQLGRNPEALEPVVRVLLEIDAGDGPARRRLDTLCEALNDYRSLARVLEELLESAHEPTQRAALGRELADLYVRRVPDDKREHKALLAWSAATPEDPEVWRRLANMYERRRRHKELLEALDALGRLEPEPEQRAAAQLAAAELCLHKLKDNAGVLARVETYVRGTTAALPPLLIDLARKAEGLAELCQLCEATGRYATLCELLNERITHTVDPERKAELYRQLATAEIEHRQDEKAALAAYEGLLGLVDDVEALRFVQAWATRHDDPKRLADALARLARCETQPEERRDLWLERGRILRNQLSQPTAAIEAFEEALAIQPDFVPALDELLSACEAAGDHARLARALEQKLELGATQPLPGLQRLAELYEGPLRDDALAIRALARWAALTPGDPQPLRRLRVQYLRSRQMPELLATLDALAGCEPEPAEQRKASVAAAELACDELDDAAGGFDRLAPLVAAADEAVDRTLLAIAERTQRLPEVYALLERAGRFGDLAYQLERAARRALEPDERAHWLRSAARVVHAHLNDVERTTAAYSELLSLEEDAEALRFMQARAHESGDAHALADSLLRLSKLETDPRELRDLLYDYAHVQTFRLRNPAVAIPVLQRILLELDADFEPALDELLRAAEAAKEPAALAFALERAIAREHDPRPKAELAERLANLHERQLNDDEAAMRSLQLWASWAPGSLEPTRRLRRLYEKHALHAKLLECLDHITTHTTSRDEGTDTALSAARLCLGPLADPDAAFGRLTELMRAGVVQAEDALHKLAADRGKLDALCDVYEQMGRHDDLCELLRKRADTEPDAGQRASLHLRCARLLANTVGDEFAAAEAYRQVLQLREDAEALRYLRSVAEQQDDVEALEHVLARLAALCDPDERPSLVLARALLLRDRLGAPERACALLRELLAETAQTPGPLRDSVVAELEATAELTEDRAALALALEARIPATRDGAKRRAIALHLADLCEAELADPDRAAAALRVACSADPRHLGARRRLKTHLARQGAWQEYLNLLDTLIHLEPNPSDRRAARLLSANTAHEMLNDGAGALTRLTPLVVAGDHEAERLAQSIAQSAGLGRELAKLYIQRARQAASPSEAEASWRLVMQIHEQWLQDPAEAFEAALRLLAADPNNRQHLTEVDRLAVSLRAFARLGQVYARLIRAAASDATRIELNMRLSWMHEQHGDAQLALEYAVQAARAAPTQTELIERVERLATAQNSQGDLFWAQEQRALTAKLDDAAIDAWLAAARTADIGLRDREQANACLRRALALTEHAPGRDADLLAVAVACEQARPELGEEDARRALLRMHLDLAEQTGPEFRTQLVLRAAKIASEALHDERTGFDVLRGGAALPPYAEPLLDALEAAAVQLGRLDALDAQLARSAERSDALADKQRLLARRARLLTDRLGRFDTAAQVYERLAELVPSDTRVAALQMECLRKAGRPRELLRACERRLAQLKDPEARLGLMREMAVIWEVELKNRASALALWIDVRELEPRDEEAARAVERLSALDAS